MGFIFIVKRGKLSEIDIDADKDWQSKGISNIKEVVSAMSKGDIIARDTSILTKIIPSGDGLVLTSRGAGNLPTWAPAGGALKYYFPFSIESSHAEAVATIDRSIAKSIAPATSHVQAYTDAPADMIKLLTPAATTSRTLAVVTVDRSHNVNARVGMDISLLVEGAVSETAAGGQTDETAAARNTTANDMHLCPMTPAVDDKYYIGSSRQFRQMWANIGTAGAGNWANQIEYYNGAWVAVTNEVDGSNDFTGSGLCHMSWDMPADWVQTTILGMNLYWVRFRTVTLINQTQAPLGTQAWYCIVVGS